MSVKTGTETKLLQGANPQITFNSTNIVFNLSLMKTVFISYQNETRERRKCLILFCVSYGDDYVF